MTYQLGVIPRFPARVVAGVGIRIDRANAVYAFSTDYSTVAPGSVADPANTDVLVQLPNGTYATVPVSAIAASTLPVAQTGKRNALINGGMAVWQRGTNFVPVAATRTYTADRWAVKTGAGTLSSVTPGATNPVSRAPYALTFVGNAGVTTLDIDQRIEAVSLAPLKGPVTFSALIANGTGSPFAPTLFVETPTALDNWTASAVQNNAGAGDALQSIPGSATVRVTWSANIGGYANLANGLAFRLRFPSGSLNSNAKVLWVSEVQVEPVAAVGTAPSLFEAEMFSDVLARCQRYYFKTFPYGTTPVQNSGTSNALVGPQTVGVSALQVIGLPLRWPVLMRGPPAITTFNPNATNIQPRNLDTGSDCSGIAVNPFEGSMQSTFTTPAGSTIGQRIYLHVTADAEL
jgi:hypothetical protein